MRNRLDVPTPADGPVEAGAARATALLGIALSLGLLLSLPARAEIQRSTAAARLPAKPPVARPSPAGAPLDWARGAVFYEVFVRSFADSDGDGIGDLRGLTAKLDYLNDGNPATDRDLGVDALWLMPVFASPSYHGYDTTSYEHINPDYGTDADFTALLAAAHARGMRVIVDLVLNHTSSEHPWFREASSSPDSPRRDWYVWRNEDPGWMQPWGGTYRVWHSAGNGFYYGVFWGGMPDLNWRNSAVRREMTRVAERWLAAGVDGFRLDATRHLVENGAGQLQVDQPETHAALRELAGALRERYPGALLVGENWTDNSRIARYYGSDASFPGGDELAASFDFPLAAAIVDAATTGDVEPIRDVLTRVAALYPREAIDAPFLTNHDMTRLTSQLGDSRESQKRAAALLLTLPGAPFLYYGEEIGLLNGTAPGDEAKRTPMPWTAESPGHGFTTGTHLWNSFSGDPAERNVELQSRDENSLLAHYRRWIALRRGSPALRSGDLYPLSGGGEGTFAFLRRAAEERLLVIHQVGPRQARFEAPIGCAALSPLLVDGAVQLDSTDENRCAIQLPAQSSWVGRVRSE